MIHFTKFSLLTNKLLAFSTINSYNSFTHFIQILCYLTPILNIKENAKTYHGSKVCMILIACPTPNQLCKTPNHISIIFLHAFSREVFQNYVFKVVRIFCREWVIDLPGNVFEGVIFCRGDLKFPANIIALVDPCQK